MIALAIVAVSLVGLMGAHNRALILLAEAERLTDATIVARDAMERTTLRPPVEPGFSDPIGREDRPEYRWIIEAKATPFEGILEVIVRLFMTDDEEREAPLVTLRSYMEIK